MGCGCNLPAVTAAGNADCKAVFEGFSAVLPDDSPFLFGWVAIAHFLERWVTTHQKSPISRILWVAVLSGHSSFKVINSLTLLSPLYF